MRNMQNFVNQEVEFVAEISVAGDVSKPAICVQNIEVRNADMVVAVDHAWIQKSDNPIIANIEERLQRHDMIHGKAKVGEYVKSNGHKDYNFTDMVIEGYE